MYRRSLRLSPLILLLVVTTNICYAKTDSPTFDELCKEFAQYIPVAAIPYINSGEVSEKFDPQHSRLYYAAVLGYISDLKSLLQSAPHGLAQDEIVLLHAIAADQRESVVALLEAGVDPGFRPAGEAPPLVVAAQCQRPELMVYLIRAGANIYATDEQGVDAMMVSMGSHSPQGAAILLSAGYDPFRRIAHGRFDLLELAERLKAPEIKALISAVRKISRSEELEE